MRRSKREAEALARAVLEKYRAEGVPEKAALKAGISTLESRGCGEDRFGRKVLAALKERLAELEAGGGGQETR